MGKAPKSKMTARQWGLNFGDEAVTWMRSSGVAARMLDDICTATTGTLDFARSSFEVDASEILAHYPLVLNKCDSLSFNNPAQALAYLALHLPDRYCRVVQVLEALLVRGMLPVARNDRFAVVDIGAGPGPAIFAVRSFYAALAHFTNQQHPEQHVAILGVADVVERSHGMSWVMHHFAEQLFMVEHSRESVTTPSNTPNPCAYLLKVSATPFSARYHDFKSLDLRLEHNRARHELAYRLEYELDTDARTAMRLAYEEPIRTPSGYSIVLMTNFLTKPDAVPEFAEAIRRLMNNALVPGGIVLVLGGVGPRYQATYATLDRIAEEAGLRAMEGFSEPLKAGSRSEELAKLQTLTRRIWKSLAERADNASDVQRQLRGIRANDIFDENLPFRLPRFQVRVYRRGGWPRNRRESM